VKLDIEVTRQGIHSGAGSGNIPECFRISRMIMNRIENVKTGEMHKNFTVKIPEEVLL
jgi:predicted PP-loop superfamily ATPase